MINLYTTIEILRGDHENLYPEMDVGNCGLNTEYYSSTINFSKYVEFGFSTDLLWALLGAGTSEQINISHLAAIIDNTLSTSSSNLVSNRAISLKFLNIDAEIEALKAAGTGGLDIEAMWKELSSADTSKVIDISHIPNIPIEKIIGTIPGGEPKFDEAFELIYTDGILTDIRAKAGLYTHQYLSAKGKNATSGGGGGDLTWLDLTSPGLEKIDNSHLNISIDGILTRDLADSLYGSGSFDEDAMWLALRTASSSLEKQIHPSHLLHYDEYLELTYFDAIHKKLEAFNFHYNEDGTLESVEVLGGLWTNDYVSAKGKNSTEGGGVFDESKMWEALAKVTSDQIDVSHLSTYDTQIKQWITNQNYLTSFTETDPVFTASAAFKITQTHIDVLGKFAIDAEGDLKALVGLYTDEYLSAKGKNTTKSGGTTGLTWLDLSTAGEEQIDISHISTALNNYYTKTQVDNLIPDVSDFITLADLSGYTLWGRPLSKTVTGAMSNVGTITPIGNNTSALGTSYLRWSTLYAGDINIGGIYMNNTTINAAAGILYVDGVPVLSSDALSNYYTKTQSDSRYALSSSLSGYVPTSRTVWGRTLSSNVTGNMTSVGNITFSGNNTLTATSLTFTTGGQSYIMTSSAFYPNGTSLDLGTSSKYWDNGYIRTLYSTEVRVGNIRLIDTDGALEIIGDGIFTEGYVSAKGKNTTGSSNLGILNAGTVNPSGVKTLSKVGTWTSSMNSSTKKYTVSHNLGSTSYIVNITITDDGSQSEAETPLILVNKFSNYFTVDFFGIAYGTNDYYGFDFIMI